MIAWNKSPTVRDYDPHGYNECPYWIDGRGHPFKQDSLALRLLPRICYPCFMLHATNPKRRLDLSVIGDATARLQDKSKVVDDETYEKSNQRQKDLLAIIARFVVSEYGMGYNNHNISRSSDYCSSNSNYWRASSVFRHLRKKFRIKGNICKGVELIMNRKEGFLGKEIIEIENYLRKQAHAHRKGDYAIPSPHCSYSLKWQQNAAAVICYPYDGPQRIYSFDIFPIATRLDIFKLLQKHKRKRAREEQLLSIDQTEYAEFIRWKEAKTEVHI